MNLQTAFAALACCLALSSIPAQAAIITSGTLTLDASDTTQTGRLLRDGNPSVWGIAKAVPPLTNTTGQRAFEIVSFNTGAFDQISWSFQLTSEFGNIFSVVYSTFNPTNIQSGYLGDSGDSSSAGTKPPRVQEGGQIDVGNNQSIALVFHAVNANSDYGTVSYTVEGFNRGEVPVPGSLPLLLIAGAGAFAVRSRKLSPKA
jgi:hypothetical protein